MDEADYIAKESLANAKAFFAHVLAIVEQLKEHPHLGRSVRVAGTREPVINASLRLQELNLNYALEE